MSGSDTAISWLIFLVVNTGDHHWWLIRVLSIIWSKRNFPYSDICSRIDWTIGLNFYLLMFCFRQQIPLFSIPQSLKFANFSFSVNFSLFFQVKFFCQFQFFANFSFSANFSFVFPISVFLPISVLPLCGVLCPSACFTCSHNRRSLPISVLSTSKIFLVSQFRKQPLTYLAKWW